jgi:limonene 1,2-monooxygenase
MNTSTSRAALRLGAFMPPWLLPMERDPTLAIRGEIEMIEYLESIGFREAWIGEHHSGGMEIVSSPELLIAAAIERTSRIRLGTGVISLPYHHPLTVADRVVQLDHQSQGRAMFGFGPGLLPSDAKMLGIPSTEQRDRLAEGLDVVLRLIAGETVTQSSSWFDLQEARLQIAPHTHPRPEIVVASAITPSGGLLAGRHGLGLLCVAASSTPGYDVLDVNWRIANETAAEHGHVLDPSWLRLVAPAHIAPTRDQAIAEIADGFARWDRHMREAAEGGGEILGMGSLEELLSGGAIIGSPADAVESLESYWEKTGGFGCMLYQLTPWASREHQRRSLRTFAEEVMAAFTGRTAPRRASHEWAASNRQDLSARARAGAEKAIAEHFGAPADAEAVSAG